VRNFKYFIISARSKSVNSVFKLFQLLGDVVPTRSTGASRLDPLRTSVRQALWAATPNDNYS